MSGKNAETYDSGHFLIVMYEFILAYPISLQLVLHLKIAYKCSKNKNKKSQTREKESVLTNEDITNRKKEFK